MEQLRQVWLKSPDLQKEFPKGLGGSGISGDWNLYDWANRYQEDYQARLEQFDIVKKAKQPEAKQEPTAEPIQPPTPPTEPTEPPTSPIDDTTADALRFFGIDIAGLSPDEQAYLATIQQFMEGQIKAGQMINPDITIDQATMAGFLEQAQREIEPYYSQMTEQVREDLIRGFEYQQAAQLAQERQLEREYGRGVEQIGEQAAERGLAYSGIRKRQERELAEQTQEALESGRRQLLYQTTGMGTAAERAVGSRALSGIGMPAIGGTPRVLAGQRAWSYGQTQLPLYKISDDVMGALEREKETAEKTMASHLEREYREKRAREELGQLFK